MGSSISFRDEARGHIDFATDGASDTHEDVAALSYLRAFVTLLVVLHHALLAYHPYMPRDLTAWGKGAQWWAAFPILDAQRNEIFGLITGFNDVFFMSLMFFISGLFVWPSLQRKGAFGFVRDRVLRLGLPFAIAAGALAPLAYYPSYLQRGGDPDVAVYWQTWLSLPSWSSGPAWFIWVLLAYGTVAALLYGIAPAVFRGLGRLASNGENAPARFVRGLVLLSAVAYVGMMLYLGGDKWLDYGPFAVQGSRIVHYALYFFAGIAVGSFGLTSGLLSPTGKLARRWWLWQALAWPAFFAVAAIVIASLSSKGVPEEAFIVGGGVAFAISCAISSFAFVALFVRFVKRHGPVWDSFSRNAYGIYLTHYVFVIWIQYALLASPLGAVAKGAIVFTAATALAWATTAFLRTFRPIGRVI